MPTISVHNQGTRPLIMNFGDRKAAMARIEFTATDAYATGGIDLTGAFRDLFGFEYVDEILFAKPTHSNTSNAGGSYTNVRCTAEWDASAQSIKLYMHNGANDEMAALTNWITPSIDNNQSHVVGMIIGK